MKGRKSRSDDSIPRRARELGRARGVAERDLCLALMAAGVHDRDFFSPGGSKDRKTPIERALVDLWHAHYDEREYWRKRADKKNRGGQ